MILIPAITFQTKNPKKSHLNSHTLFPYTSYMTAPYVPFFDPLIIQEPATNRTIHTIVSQLTALTMLNAHNKKIHIYECNKYSKYDLI